MEVSFVSLLSCSQFGWWDEQWGVGHPTPYPTHPFPSSLCEDLYILAWSWWAMRSRTLHPLPYPPFSFLIVWRVLHPSLLLMSNEEQDTPPLPYPLFSFLTVWRFCISDNMCISLLPAVVLAYWDLGGLAHFTILPKVHQSALVGCKI